MARIGVCDDSPEMAKRIAEAVKSAFESCGTVCETVIFTGGAEILNENQKNPFDVLFLDIDMPKMSGFEVAKALRDGFSDCIIVFVTSHSELVFDSLDFQPFNFIRKNGGGLLEDSIFKIAGKISFHLRQGETVLLEDRSAGKIPVMIKSIISAESSGHYLIYSTWENGGIKKIISRGSISEQEEFFEKYGFARSHKGFEVNLNHIKRFNSAKRVLGMTGEIEIPIGKKHREQLEEKYRLFLRRKS